MAAQLPAAPEGAEQIDLFLNMAASGEAAQLTELELPVGTTLATVPQKDEVAIPMLYEKTLEVVQQVAR